MTEKLEDIEKLGRQASDELVAASSTDALERWRVAWIGRKGNIPTLLRNVRDMPAGERKAAGEALNALRGELEGEYEIRKKKIENGKSSAEKKLQPTSYNLQAGKGHLHPLTLAFRKIQEIFLAMGFTVVEGPDVELAQYNFDALNIDLEHPARAETDTFYLKDFPDLVLRTHVSTLQTRGVMEHHLMPPFRMVYYGPSYRSEKEDATHASLFQQYEFMVVDEKVNLSDLKTIVTTFYTLFFGKDVEVRFRPSYFPFVKPGLEVDMRDTTTKKGGWLEMAGAGMVHPNVLRSINVDPEKYQGIALGGGLDRLVMLKHGITDIRLLYSGELKFLRQFN